MVSYRIGALESEQRWLSDDLLEVSKVLPGQRGTLQIGLSG